MIIIALWIGVVLLILVAILEIWYPTVINEGFTNLVGLGDSIKWMQWVPRNGSVGPEKEQNGFITDKRYFNGYTDVQRLGVNQDWCRMVLPKGANEKDTFFACALGGTDGLSTIEYRSKNVWEGFQLSRDDYMGKFDEGHVGYCRILKTDENTFECKCNVADDLEFSDSLRTDVNPPNDIAMLMRFYQGIVFWLRFRDDMRDYAGNLIVGKVGELEMDESKPNPEVTEGLKFNGVNEYLRIGDNKDLEFGNVIQLRYLRAMCFWVYFDEFTNEAHILDFGNGPGKDNVWVGIVGRGNDGIQTEPIRPLLCGGESTIPEPPSGAQGVPLVSPQVLMETTSANCNEYDCKKPEVFGRIMDPLKRTTLGVTAKNADLAYEVWDHSQRKMRLVVKNAIPLKKWVHVAITATSNDASNPIIAIYINGEVALQEGGYLPQTNYTEKNYIGRSNWIDVTTMYENASELFKGRIFDLRGYRLPMPQSKITETVTWGKKMLGIK
jgi:hypothetical protein